MELHITQEQWDSADLEQRRHWRAEAWLVGGKIAPGYPTGEPVIEDLYGPGDQAPAGSQLISFGTKKSLGVDTEGRKRSSRKKKAA